MTDKHMDEAIDRAVREMMRVDPRPGLSRRVRARIDARPSTTMTLPRLAAAAALVMVAIVAGWLLTRTPGVEMTRTGVVGRNAEGRSEAPGPPDGERYEDTSPEEHHDNRPAKPGRYEWTRSGRQRVPEEIPPFVSNVAVNPLAPVTPIAVAPVAPRALDAQEVTIAPLDPLEPLRVVPLPTPQ